MTAPTEIRMYGTVGDSIVDGPGLRYSVFVQGCTHRCPGCHNPESQPADGGYLESIEKIVADIEANKLVHDVTLSGGEPFEQAAACAELARRLKEKGYGIWTYSGYRYETLKRCADQAAVQDTDQVSDQVSDQDTRQGATQDTAQDAQAATNTQDAPQNENDHGQAASLDPQGVRDLLQHSDVLVDGVFVEALKSLELQWCGSSNQRLIDLPATRAKGEVVLWKKKDVFPTKPASW